MSLLITFMWVNGSVVYGVDDYQERSLTSGECGELTTWKYANGLLTLNGEGEMQYCGTDDCPWANYRNKITTVKINEGVTNIGSFAFYNCKSLKKITLPTTLKSIGDSAFKNCTSLKTITLSNNIKTIGDNAFNSCTNLRTLVIPDNVREISFAAFENCQRLQTITLSNRLTTISSRMFNGCKQLKSITIPNRVTSIETCAFNECYNLKTVKLSTKIREIYDYAFAKCKNLTHITLSPQIGILGTNLFDGCTKLTVSAALNSQAMTYVKSNKLKYRYIGDEKNTITLNKKTVSTNKNKTFKLVSTIKTIPSAPDTRVKWKSSNPSIATVDQKGVVKTKNPGKVSIKAILTSGKYAKCQVTVKDSLEKCKVVSSSAIYANKAVKPNLTVKYGETLLQEGTDYTVNFVDHKNNKYVGLGYLQIKGKGSYTGVKEVTYKIVPKKVVQHEPKAGKKSFTVNYKKTSQVSGYVIAYQKKGSNQWSYVSTKDLSKKITGLQSNKYYCIKVRGYKTVGKTKYYGSYSVVKTVKVK